MKMQLKDIAGKGNKTVLRLLHPGPVDPVADAYKRVRDATVCNDNLPNGQAIAILELIKAELTTAMQAELDGAE